MQMYIKMMRSGDLEGQESETLLAPGSKVLSYGLSRSTNPRFSFGFSFLLCGFEYMHWIIWMFRLAGIFNCDQVTTSWQRRSDFIQSPGTSWTPWCHVYWQVSQGLRGKNTPKSSQVLHHTYSGDLFLDCVTILLLMPNPPSVFVSENTKPGFSQSSSSI